MAFQTPITIRRAIESIRRNEFVLPAIQREFVWGTDKICKLFDSLMRGYPVGSFLFWKVDRAHCREYKFYGFLSDYHERDNRHNPTLDLKGEGGVTAILDGQQRLTSLYIGLLGSHTTKLPHKRWKDAQSFPKRRLYLNLLAPADTEGVDLKFDFRFLPEGDLEQDDHHHWFPVGEILTFSSLKSIYTYLRSKDLLASTFADECLCTLYQTICETPLINHYQEEDQDLDKVLNIFVRLNSGGIPLSYSDLLLSIATAQWTKADARQTIHGLVDDLNRTGDGFAFDKDFVLKSSLVLTDLDVGFKVHNFTRENTHTVEAEWPTISLALLTAAGLAAQCGYNGSTLTATNALIPIAYYLAKRGVPQGFLERSEYAADRRSIQSWLTRALLKKGTFGAGLDTTLRTARATIGASPARFPVEDLDAAFAKLGRGLRFVEEEVDALLDEEYGGRTTFSVLALLYPAVDFGNRFHEDHVFPKSKFTAKRLRDAGVPEEQIADLLERVDRVANLQLLEGASNQAKGARMPAEWLEEHYTSSEERLAWNQRNYIDVVPAQMTGFLEFYEKRRQRMKARLLSLLAAVQT